MKICTPFLSFIVLAAALLYAALPSAADSDCYYYPGNGVACADIYPYTVNVPPVCVKNGEVCDGPAGDYFPTDNWSEVSDTEGTTNAGFSKEVISPVSHDCAVFYVCNRVNTPEGFNCARGIVYSKSRGYEEVLNTDDPCNL